MRTFQALAWLAVIIMGFLTVFMRYDDHPSVPDDHKDDGSNWFLFL
jgi:hypothetical protein